MILKQPFLFSLFIVMICSCVKLNPDESNLQLNINGNGLVLIGNEGNFQYGNSSLSTYNKYSFETSSEVYQSVNQSPIGDVLHSINHIEHELFLVVNNSGKIIIIDDESFSFINEISPLVSPRKIIKINNGKYYITDLYSNSIHIYNRYNESISEIKVNGWCEDLIAYNGKAYVCNRDNNQVYVIDCNNDLIIDSIQVGENPVSIQEDKLNRLWVLSQGNSQNNTYGSVSIIDPLSQTVTESFNIINNGNNPSALRIDKSSENVYFLCGDVYKLSSINDTIAEIIWINSGETFYNLEVDPYNNDIYLCNAKDYVQNGSILIIDSTGNLKNEVTTGIIPKSIIF